MSQISLFPEFEPEEARKTVNIASVPQRSPFRYPGGKTWFVPLFRKWLQNQQSRPRTLVEPFAGGGIIGLTAAFEKLAEKVVLIEKDDQIAAVWQSILGEDAEWLSKMIISFEMSLQNVRSELARNPSTRRELAFQTILKNRTSHGGILAEGAGILKHGENGKGIHSRWYPQTIARRIATISFIANKITFVQGDAFESLVKFKGDKHAVFFIDPPYTAGGKRAGARLYTHSDIDHERLFSICEELRGEFLLTYDNAEEVHTLARRHGFEVRPIAMKNTHHSEMTELLIGRRLGWMDDRHLVREKLIRFKNKGSSRGIRLLKTKGRVHQIS